MNGRLKPYHSIYVRSMGKVFRVTAIFTDVDKCNEYMAEHTGEALICSLDRGNSEVHFLAEVHPTKIEIIEI